MGYGAHMKLHTEAVKRALSDRGMLHRHAAKQIGITPGDLSKYVTASRDCPTHVFAALVTLLGVDPKDFIGPQDPEQAVAYTTAALGIDGDRLDELHAQHGFAVAS